MGMEGVEGWEVGFTSRGDGEEGGGSVFHFVNKLIIIIPKLCLYIIKTFQIKSNINFYTEDFHFNFTSYTNKNWKKFATGMSLYHKISYHHLFSVIV